MFDSIDYNTNVDDTKFIIGAIETVRVLGSEIDQKIRLFFMKNKNGVSSIRMGSGL